MKNNKHSFEPYYNQLPINDAIDAGYFIPKHNEINWQKHITIPCTPINFLKSQTLNDCPKAVIISTGALCPLHEGHIHMMEQAYHELVLNQGFDVIGGYLSPGHDEYIKEKTGDNWMPIHNRIEWANNMIKDYYWLAIDPWEGVFAPGAVNFTSVVYRLNEYIKKFYHTNVKLFFVCGEDNARFAKVFKNTDIGCVVVGRPGYEHNTILNEYVSKHILYTCGNIKQSSTEIRKTKEYKDFKENSNKKKQAYLRIHLNNNENNVLEQLRKYFSIIWPKDFDEQLRDFKQNNKIDKTIINLDVETYHGRKLDISRLYDLFGQKKIGYTHRPGTYPVEKQIETLINKEYFNECYLFDDDIFTGSTMTYVEKLLNNKNIKVLGRLSYISGTLKDKEVLDAKDFLFAYSTGGLVTKIDDELIRVPYLYPFVCPTTRASIDNPLEFSISLWKLNMDIWKYNYDTIQDYKDLKYLIKLGHSKNELIYEVCKYYYDLLIEIKKYYV